LFLFNLQIFISTLLQPPKSTLFPYTTLFRSDADDTFEGNLTGIAGQRKERTFNGSDVLEIRADALLDLLRGSASSSYSNDTRKTITNREYVANLNGFGCRSDGLGKSRIEHVTSGLHWSLR